MTRRKINDNVSDNDKNCRNYCGMYKPFYVGDVFEIIITNRDNNDDDVVSALPADDNDVIHDNDVENDVDDDVDNDYIVDDDFECRDVDDDSDDDVNVDNVDDCEDDGDADMSMMVEDGYG